MPAQQHFGNTSFTPGTTTFEIDGLPNNSNGFELIIERTAGWDTLTGNIFWINIEIDVGDGLGYQQWLRANAPGGVIIGRDGNPLTRWRMHGIWPGVNDGTGQNKNKILRATNLRTRVEVEQAFTAASIDVRTI